MESLQDPGIRQAVQVSRSETSRAAREYQIVSDERAKRQEAQLHSQRMSQDNSMTTVGTGFFSSEPEYSKRTEVLYTRIRVEAEEYGRQQSKHDLETDYVVVVQRGDSSDNDMTEVKVPSSFFVHNLPTWVNRERQTVGGAAEKRKQEPQIVTKVSFRCLGMWVEVPREMLIMQLLKVSELDVGNALVFYQDEQAVPMTFVSKIGQLDKYLHPIMQVLAVQPEGGWNGCELFLRPKAHLMVVYQVLIPKFMCLTRSCLGKNPQGRIIQEERDGIPAERGEDHEEWTPHEIEFSPQNTIMEVL
jgi:hypothetical protein